MLASLGSPGAAASKQTGKAGSCAAGSAGCCGCGAAEAWWSGRTVRHVSEGRYIFGILILYNYLFNYIIMDIYFKCLNIIFNIHTPSFKYLINILFIYFVY